MLSSQRREHTASEQEL